MADTTIYVQMLGGFSLTYAGQPVTLEQNGSTKASQLLQYLLYHQEEGATRDRLIEILYGDDDISSPQNNLKVNIFRLRKLLKLSHLPDGEYIVHKEGCYYWRSELNVEIDALCFAKAADRAADFRLDTGKRCELTLLAASLYRGDFLPMVATEPWVAAESVRYRNTYLTCVRDACELLSVNKDYGAALELCERAVKLCPYDEELHLQRISLLLDMQRYSDALTAYDEASRLFLEELGVSPSQDMLSLYRRMTGNIRHSTDLIDQVKENLRRDQPERGAYYCTYPGFMDSYLYVSRLVERSGLSIFLMLTTITDAHGVPLELGDRLCEAAEVLHNAIYQALRRSDLFTRYSPCQFLSLLTGTSRENCELVAARLNVLFREGCELRGVRLHHSFTSGLAVDAGRPMKFGDKLWGNVL